jgi:hypothetical protein
MAYSGDLVKFFLHWEGWGGAWKNTTTDKDYNRIKAMPFWGPMIN